MTIVYDPEKGFVEIEPPKKVEQFPVTLRWYSRKDFGPGGFELWVTEAELGRRVIGYLDEQNREGRYAYPGDICEHTFGIDYQNGCYLWPHR